MTMTNNQRSFAHWALMLVVFSVMASVGIEKSKTTRRQEELAATILRSRKAVIGVDASGVIVEWNGAATELTGYQRHESVGFGLAFLIPPELRARHHRAMIAAVHRGALKLDMQQIEIPLMHRDGHQIPSQLSISMPMAGDLMFLAEAGNQN